jgi:hypothetical protein
MITQEIQAANVANQIISLTSALYGIGQQISQASAAWTNLSVANKLNAFPTAALTSTGGLGTPDGAPVDSNPINVGVAPGTAISRAISANDLAALLGYLQGIATAIGGGAVGANGAAVQLVAKAV